MIIDNKMMKMKSAVAHLSSD